MKSKIKVLILCIVCIFCLCIVVNYNFSKNISENINNNTNPNNYKKNNNGISMMLEKTEGTGDYEVSTLSSWPLLIQHYQNVLMAENYHGMIKIKLY